MRFSRYVDTHSVARIVGDVALVVVGGEKDVADIVLSFLGRRLRVMTCPTSETTCPTIGALIATQTTTFNIPYRPSYDGWYSPTDGRCKSSTWKFHLATLRVLPTAYTPRAEHVTAHVALSSCTISVLTSFGFNAKVARTQHIDRQ